MSDTAAIPLGAVHHARDISDEAFLDAIRQAAGDGGWATRWDVGSVLAGLAGAD